MIVKPLNPRDFDITMNLFHYYRDEAIESIPKIEEEYNENTVINTIRNYAIASDSCWFNIYEGQRPVGFVAGYMVAKPWNDQQYIGHIQFIYLIETHRTLENFKMLLNNFEEWAKLAGCDEISAGDIGINVDRMKKLYSHFGFQEQLSMTKELAHE